MATKEAIDALQIGDKVEVEMDPGVWIPVEINRPDGRGDHLTVLIEHYGYARMRLPGSAG